MDPLVVHQFYLSIGNHVQDMVFRECSGIGSESEVIEYKASGKSDYNTIAAIPGRLKWQKISLKRGITDSMDAWTWRKLVEDGNVSDARANGTIIMVAQDGTPSPNGSSSTPGRPRSAAPASTPAATKWASKNSKSSTRG